jgi:hypothetical protein
MDGWVVGLLLFGNAGNKSRQQATGNRQRHRYPLFLGRRSAVAAMYYLLTTGVQSLLRGVFFTLLSVESRGLCRQGPRCAISCCRPTTVAGEGHHGFSVGVSSRGDRGCEANARSWQSTSSGPRTRDVFSCPVLFGMHHGDVRRCSQAPWKWLIVDTPLLRCFVPLVS